MYIHCSFSLKPYRFDTFMFRSAAVPMQSNIVLPRLKGIVDYRSFKDSNLHLSNDFGNDMCCMGPMGSL